MKKITLILTSLICIFSVPANAEKVRGGPALGCKSAVKFLEIVEVNKFDEVRAKKLIDQAINTGKCRLFDEGTSLELAPTSKGSELQGVFLPGTIVRYYLFKGRVN
ncbi:MAG: hypothetical protein DHS20C08_14060 [Rhodomicrobium sp.]|nr:MAG: hypothetical protein DHS20C08_14060 [Rhodomicrobium sp.]